MLFPAPKGDAEEEMAGAPKFKVGTEVDGEAAPNGFWALDVAPPNKGVDEEAFEAG